MTANEELAEAHKQIVMLREAIVGLWGSPYWKPHNAPMSVILPLQKALDATQDLSGLVLCEAERTACMRVAEMAKLMLDPDKGQYEKGWFDAATRIAEDIEERK